MMRRRAALALAITLAARPLAAAAAADDTPFPFPQTDVTVVYAIPGVPGAAQTLRVDARNGRERVDAPGGGLIAITDLPHGVAILLDPRADTFVRENAPGGAHDPRGVRAPPGAYARTGRDTVNGEACTDWTTPDGMTLCLTGDGVALSVARGGRTVLSASAVTRAPVADRWFALPPGARPAPAADGGGAPTDRT